jgi:hypothetical protein
MDAFKEAQSLNDSQLTGQLLLVMANHYHIAANDKAEKIAKRAKEIFEKGENRQFLHLSAKLLQGLFSFVYCHTFLSFLLAIDSLQIYLLDIYLRTQQLSQASDNLVVLTKTSQSQKD